MHTAHREVIQITSAVMDPDDPLNIPNLVVLCSDQSIWWYSTTDSTWINVRNPLLEHENGGEGLSIQSDI